MIQFCNFSPQNYPIQSRSHEIIPSGRKELISVLGIKFSFGVLAI